MQVTGVPTLNQETAQRTLGKHLFFIQCFGISSPATNSDNIIHSQNCLRFQNAGCFSWTAGFVASSNVSDICPLPRNISHAHLTTTGLPPYDEGHTASYTCEPCYQGKGKVTCLQDGNWSRPPSCTGNIFRVEHKLRPEKLPNTCFKSS